MQNYIAETFLEYPDNSSLATILYMRGCSGNCVGCHNLELKKYEELPKDIGLQLIKACKKNKTNKIVLCGGDPLYFANIGITNQIIMALHNDFDICIYTGYEIDFVKKSSLEKGFKYIKCGPYLEEFYIGSKKTDEYIQFATSNQALYDSQYNLLSLDGIYKFK